MLLFVFVKTVVFSLLLFVFYVLFCLFVVTVLTVHHRSTLSSMTGLHLALVTRRDRTDITSGTIGGNRDSSNRYTACLLFEDDKRKTYLMLSRLVCVAS